MRRATSAEKAFSRFVGIRGYQDSWWRELAQRSEQIRGPELLYRRQEFAGGDRGAFFGGDREDAAGAVGLQLVLHLHGFHYDDALTGDHLVAGVGRARVTLTGVGVGGGC